MPNPENIIGKGFDKRPENRNSTGLNRGVRWSKNVIAEHLQTVIKRKNELTGTEEEKSAFDHIIVKAIAQALEGNTKALKELLDRLEGTSIQTIDYNIGGESSLNTPLLTWVETSVNPNEIIKPIEEEKPKEEET